MSTVKVNIRGITELDFPTGVSSATVTQGVVTINLSSSGGVTSITGDGFVYTNSLSMGAVTLTLGNQSANTVFAGPTSGGATTPTFRALVAADIPSLSGLYPSKVATVDSTAQGASIGTTTLYAIPASGAGMYRVSYYMKVTTAASSSSSVTLALSWTDRSDSSALSVTIPTPANSTAIGGVVSGSLIVDAALSTNLQYATTYVSSGGTAMQYTLRVRVEAL